MNRVTEIYEDGKLVRRITETTLPVPIPFETPKPWPHYTDWLPEIPWNVCIHHA